MAKHKYNGKEAIVGNPTHDNPGKEPTPQELLREQMREAVASEDWKAVGKVSADLAKLEKDAERAARDAAESAVKDLTMLVKDRITQILTPMIESGELDGCDGVWYSMDFGDEMAEGGYRPASCKLLKSAAKAPRATGGGGGGTKFNVSYKEFLAKYGDNLVNEADAEYRSALKPCVGMTWKEAYEAGAGEKSPGNFRYHIRECWLHKDGLI